MCAQVLAGSVVAQGETEAVISATGGSTFFGKTVALLAEPEEVGHLRKVCPSCNHAVRVHEAHHAQMSAALRIKEVLEDACQQHPE